MALSFLNNGYFAGKVGIGETSPNYNLVVGNGITDTESRFYHSDASYTSVRGYGLFMSRGTSYIRPVNDGSQTLHIGSANNTWGTFSADANTFTLNRDGVSRLYINSTGNVGIGATNPSAKLEVAFDGSHTSGDISYTQANIDVYNPLQANTDEKGSIITFTDNYFDGTNYPKTTRAAIKGGTDTVGNTANGFLAFYTDSGGANSATERMRIDSSGNVGIGVASPQGTLDVRSDASNSVPKIIVGNSTTTYNQTNSGSIVFTEGGTYEHMEITYNGVSNKLLFNSPIDSTTGLLTINRTGNVGIGTISPGYKLEVVGNAKVSSNFYIGNVDAVTTATEVLVRQSDRVRGITPANLINASGGPFLPLAGGTMTGPINMGDFDITDIDELKFSSGTKLGDVGGSNYVRITYNSTGAGGLQIVDNQGQLQGYLYGDGGVTSSFGLLDGTGSWAVKCVENLYVELRYDNSIKLTTASTGITVTGDIQIDSALLSNQENTDVDTGAEVVAQVSTSTYTAAFFDFVIKKTTNVRSGTVYACHDGTNVEFTETSTNDLGDTSDVTLSVDISGANMELQATTTSDNWSIKSLIRAI